MNYTRDPIIETVITPKEGFKLIVKSSKNVTEEEYSVDALEVVSFGSALFFRSQERPRPFLLPVTDYEVLEGKEARMVLKKAQVEKNIKIGGGKKPTPPPVKPPEEPKAKKRRTRRRRSDERADENSVDYEEVAAPQEEVVKAPPRPLLPPPSSLISEHLSRYKNFRITEVEQDDEVESFEDSIPIAPMIPDHEQDLLEESQLDEYNLKDEDELDTSTDASLFIDDEIMKND